MSVDFTSFSSVLTPLFVVRHAANRNIFRNMRCALFANVETKNIN
ncbi:hypothetical protein HMPREF1583_00484 [Gardnerella vaginalis JCP8151B]|nr:hypothetical protein HMPREF1583_00484 [Gardnerella vaginalis JCP8151B]